MREEKQLSFITEIEYLVDPLVRDAIWPQLADYIQEQTGDAASRAFFAELAPLGVFKSDFVVVAPDRMSRDAFVDSLSGNVEAKLIELLEEELSLNRSISLKVIVAYDLFFGGLLERDPGRWMEALSKLLGDFPHIFTSLEESPAGDELFAPNHIGPYLKYCLWPQVLGRLRKVLSGHDYSTWFQGAVFPVGLYGSTFLIYGLNSSACSHIDHHYREELSEILSAILHRVVSVRIVDEASLSEHTPNELIESFVKESQPGTPEGQVDHGGTETFLLHAGIDRKTLDQGLYEAIVRPDRIVAIPKMYLAYLPYLGPALMSIVVAFRQILYLREGGNLKKSDCLMEVSYEELAAWSGMSRIAVIRNMKKKNTGLEWFVEKVPYRADEVSYYYDEVEGVTKQRPVRYRFKVKPPVPVGDAIAIEKYLVEAGIRTDPVGALTGAIAEKIGNILPVPASTPPKNWLKLDSSSLTMTDIVKPLCGIANYTKEISELVQELEEHLFPRDQVVMVSWYSVREWSTKVSPGIFWAYVLFKSYTFYNRNTGESRPVAELKGGFTPSARVLGIKAKTMREWFLSDTTDTVGVCEADFPFSEDPKERARQLAQKSRLEASRSAQKLAQAVVTDTKGRKITKVDVRVAERIPLTPEHELEKDRLLDFGDDFVRASRAIRSAVLQYYKKFDPCESQEDVVLNDLSSTDDTHTPDGLDTDDMHTIKVSAADDTHALEVLSADEIHTPVTSDADDTSNNRELSSDDTLAVQLSFAGATHAPVLSDADDIYDTSQMIRLKIPIFKLPKKIILGYLNYLQDSLESPQTVAPSNKNGETGSVVVGIQGYNLSEIIYRLTKNKKTTQELLNLKPTSEAVVSTLLYMASGEGDRLKDAYFVSRLRENPQEIYSYEFGKIAGWSPGKVFEHIIHSLDPWESEYAPDSLWNEAMRDASPIKLQKLYYWLTGEVL
jgi:hypothetical protein